MAEAKALAFNVSVPSDGLQGRSRLEKPLLDGLGRYGDALDPNGVCVCVKSLSLSLALSLSLSLSLALSLSRSLARSLARLLSLCMYMYMMAFMNRNIQ